MEGQTSEIVPPGLDKGSETPGDSLGHGEMVVEAFLLLFGDSWSRGQVRSVHVQGCGEMNRAEEKTLFKVAKHIESDQWLSSEAVVPILKARVPTSRIMKMR